MPKNTFPSKYTEKEVSAASYLVEIICERIAEKKKEKLPQKFWQTADWKRTFLAQMTHANALLKEFEVSVIIAGLNHFDGKKVYSLGAKYALLPILQKLKKAKDLAGENHSVVESLDINQKPRSVKTKRNLLGDLE